MNKKEFILRLKYELNYDEEKCTIINDILESNFFLSKSKKDIIIKKLVESLDIDSNEALKIYDISLDIIKDEVKNKFKHPFKSKD